MDLSLVTSCCGIGWPVVTPREYGFDMLFVRQCPVCARPNRTICLPCWESMNPAGEVAVDGINWCQAIFAYSPETRSVVLTGKNRGRRDLLRKAATVMADEVSASPHRSSYDVVTWVPASPAQRRRRGFDQGRILGCAVARRLGVPARPLLRRSGSPQTGQSRVARLNGPEIQSLRPCSGTLLLVDDVITTGGSLRRASEVLHNSGASLVDAVVFAAVQPSLSTLSPTLTNIALKGASHGGKR